MIYSLFGFASSELGVSSFTVNLILLSSTAVLMGLPVFFIQRKGEGKSAF